MSDDAEIVKKRASLFAPIIFVAETMFWGVKKALNPRTKVDNHAQQHGLDDARSEMSQMLSGTMEAIGTGNLLTAIGRPLALAFDLLHSVNLIRHPGDGRDMMTGENMVFTVPQYVKVPDGTTDVQDLRLSPLSS